MSYSFLRESKLYLVYGGTKYNIRTTSAITFNQTFAEDSYPVKTLHEQTKKIEVSTITKANPATFTVEVPLTIEKDESIVLDLISDLVATTDAGISTQQLKSFDMYVQTGSSTFKIENCIITQAVFDINRTDQFKVQLEGEGTKLSRAGDENFSIPGSAQSETSTRTPLLVFPSISIGGTNVKSLLSCNVQIQNNVEWTPFENLQNSLSVTSPSNVQYPDTYTVGTRIVSGAITQYQTDNNINDHVDFSTNVELIITAKKVSDSSDFWKLTLNPAMYTARLNPSDIYTKSYDYRSLDNTAVGTRISVYS